MVFTIILDMFSRFFRKGINSLSSVGGSLLDSVVDRFRQNPPLNEKRILPQIEHIVVLMLENRSFDSTLGWLYDQQNHPKKFIIPYNQKKQYDGLTYANFSVRNEKGKTPEFLKIKEGVTHREFPIPGVSAVYHNSLAQLDTTNINNKIGTFGHPSAMDGFYTAYASFNRESREQILETYNPEQLSVLNGLAREYPLSDAWFSSVPAHTLSNRAFLHAGTSEGVLVQSNRPLFRSRTIFNVLLDYDVSCKVYKSNKVIPSLARASMTRLSSPSLHDNLGEIDDFLKDAKNGTLPSYSFLEPHIISEQLKFIEDGIDNSYHPPSDVLAAEKFLAKIWDAVRLGKNWEKTLFITVFDEHGGFVDHVSPPWGASIPSMREGRENPDFSFNRFGVRVPVIIASPWVDEKTIFRSLTDVPYDDTSIAATILDWQGIPRKNLKSKRIQNAPNFSSVVTRNTPRLDSKPLTVASETLFTPSSQEKKDILEQSLFKIYKRQH